MTEAIIVNDAPGIVISQPVNRILIAGGGTQGAPGVQGPRGDGIQFISSLPSTDDLPSIATLGDTYIISGELWIYGSSGWEDAGPLQGPQGETGAEGEQGPAGASVELRITETHVQWKLTGGEWDDLVALEDLKGDPGENGAEGPKGDPGENIELQLTETHIQWRAGEAGTWQNLVALADIEGPQGEQGEQGEPGQGLVILGSLPSSGDLPASGELGDGYIISCELWVWTGTEWEDVGVIQGPAGADGRTILSGSGAPTTEGEDGDFYINTSSWEIFGPKATTWAAGVPMVGVDGQDGASGTNGEDGADGRTILSGTVDPTAEGEDGDFYINTTSWQIFGPKATTWPAGVDIVGADGADGTDGTNGQAIFKESGVWICPEGVTRVFISMCGGGGGGGSTYTSASTGASGNAGGSSSFGALLLTNGGGGGIGSSSSSYGWGGSSGGIGGTPGDTGFRIATTPPISISGRGGSCFLGIGGPPQLGTSNGDPGCGFGAGGGGGTYANGAGAGGGGGAQAYLMQEVAVAPGTGYTIIIGAGGAGGASTYRGGNGAPGICIIEW